MSHIIHLNITHEVAGQTQECDLETGIIYILIDPEGRVRYVGSSTCDEQTRLKLHETQTRYDHQSSPLYRHIHDTGGFDGWTIRTIRMCDMINSS